MNAKLQIKRPDGKIEWIESEYHQIYYPQLPKIQDEYAAAGLGEVLSYQNPELQVFAHSRSNSARKTYSMRKVYAQAHAEEHAANGRCPKCGTYCYGDCQM